MPDLDPFQIWKFARTASGSNSEPDFSNQLSSSCDPKSSSSQNQALSLRIPKSRSNPQIRLKSHERDQLRLKTLDNQPSSDSQCRYQAQSRKIPNSDATLNQTLVTNQAVTIIPKSGSKQRQTRSRKIPNSEATINQTLVTNQAVTMIPKSGSKQRQAQSQRILKSGSIPENPKFRRNSELATNRAVTVILKSGSNPTSRSSSEKKRL